MAANPNELTIENSALILIDHQPAVALCAPSLRTDVLINNVHEAPDLFRLDSHSHNHWLTVKLVGTQSNRSAIGARVRCTSGGINQWQEVRGGRSYYSQSDLRVHFGLGLSTKVDRLEVRWPRGLEESWTDLAPDAFVTLKEGSGSLVLREGKSDMKNGRNQN